ncbi:MAG: CHAT domain-containing protein, partial [Bacteroidia bacterium]|nr:CHAT domain-containing protein [Bacteroidia bacterium]
TLPSEYNANYNKIQLIESIKIKSNILKKINKPNYESFLLLSSLLKSLRLENSTASHKDFWANENLNIYQDAIATFIDNDDIESAFTFAEENKSNLLVQSLNDIEAKSYANIPAELLEKENDLRAKLQFYQKKKFELENSDNIDSTKLIDYFELITTTEFAIDEIVDTLESHYPEYYELKYNEEDLKAADIKNILDDKTAFIEYFVGKDSAYVFTITKDNISVNSLDILSDSTNIFLKYYQSISDPNVSATFLDSHSKSTYKLVLEKALENINSNIQDLIIVPDDILNNLPFELMKNEKDEYLGFKYNIHYQYSGRLWRLLKNRKSFDKKYDFLGYAYNSDNVNYIAERACATMETGNLLCSDKEIQNIATILKDKSLLLKNANKDDILKNASQSRIVHLATHSCLDSENSDYSRIFFNDGYITNIDLQLQTMNADLAVLSACESGYGELIKGEGAMSISKGFFHAGCKSTLVSLWPVDDCSTSEFMGHFYTYLNEGLQKDVALKKAKQTYLETAHPSRTHPYYWAGFILIGDNAAVFGNGGGYLIWVMGFLGLLVFGWCIKKV